jgi:hypothetical protein
MRLQTLSGTPQAPIAVPRTRADLDALVQLRSELRDQLSSLNSRRTEMIAQQRVGGERVAAQAAPRIAALDERATQLEDRIRSADDAITAGIAQGLAVGGGERVISIPPPPGRRQTAELDRILALNGMGFILLGAFMWLIVRRRLRGSPAPALADQSRRLDQLQQAVDTMAVEVERISESQRYVAKLLTERMPALGASAAQPVEAKRAEPLPARDTDRDRR